MNVYFLSEEAIREGGSQAAQLSHQWFLLCLPTVVYCLTACITHQTPLLTAMYYSPTLLPRSRSPSPPSQTNN